MTPAQAKRKGAETEQRLVDHLRTHGLPHVERRRLTGAHDQGDIAGWPGVCVEVKSGGRIDLPGWLSELAAEKANAHAEVGFVAVRPKGTPDPSGWYCVLTLADLLDLMASAGWIAQEAA